MDQESPQATPSTPTTSVRTENPVTLEADLKPVTPSIFSGESIGRAAITAVVMHGEELGIPDDPNVLGWWGAKAGAKKGTVLLVGHTVHTGGGFLDDLEDYPVGGSVDVSGRSYTVMSNRVLSKARLAQIAPQLFSQTGPPRLVVVTCEGYDPATGHYSSNVVMVAK